MSKYRRLSEEELQVLEPDFIQFLASNSIDAPSWKKYLEEDLEKAEAYIDSFSQVVFDKALEKIKYLEVVQGNDAKFFRCDKGKIILRAVRLKTDADIAPYLDKDENPMEDMELYGAEKAYKPNREEEIFRMLHQGAAVSKGVWFEKINKHY